MHKLDFLALKFKEYLKTRNYSERTISNYGRCVKYLLDFLKELGIENISEVDRNTMLDYQTRIYLHTYKDKPLSPATRMERVCAVRAFFCYLVKVGTLMYNPAGDLEIPKQPKKLPKNILSKKEIGQLLSAPNLETDLGVRDRAILETFYATGIRLGELCNLLVNDLDLSSGELRVNNGKNAKDRVVPLGEVAGDYLEMYLREVRPKWVAASQKALFVTQNGNKFLRTHITTLVSKYGKKAGLEKKVGPHLLRHSCATHLLKGKADIRHIQEMLGHENISTTQRYAQVEISDLKKVIKRCHPRERREIETRDL